MINILKNALEMVKTEFPGARAAFTVTLFSYGLDVRLKISHGARDSEYHQIFQDEIEPERIYKMVEQFKTANKVILDSEV